jgi:hypothetical protein
MHNTLQTPETIQQLSTGCPSLSIIECLPRHDIVAKEIDQELVKDAKLTHKTKKLNSVAFTELLPFVSEVSANFCR